MEIITTVRDYIRQELAADRPDAPLAPTDDLVVLGLIDSVGILKLIAFLETTFAIEVHDEEVVPENFGSLAQIEHFVLAKLGEKR